IPIFQPLAAKEILRRKAQRGRQGIPEGGRALDEDECLGGHATFLDRIPRSLHPSTCPGRPALNTKTPFTTSWPEATGVSPSFTTTAIGSFSSTPWPRPVAGRAGASSLGC